MTGGRFDTLYDALVVERTASPRAIRKIARNLRRDAATDPAHLHDVCLAEEVLGRAELRAEYDALVARMEAAGMQAPKIGVAIEAEPLGPDFAARVGAGGAAAVDVTGKVLRAILPLTLGIGLLIAMGKCLGSSGTGRYDSNRFEYKPIQPIQIPKFEYDSKATSEMLERLRRDMQSNEFKRPSIQPYERPSFETQKQMLEKKYPPRPPRVPRLTPAPAPDPATSP